jgi:predicted esterase
MMPTIFGLTFLVTLLVAVFGGRVPVVALSVDEAVKLSRAFLASDDRAERRKIAKQLAEYDGSIDAVVEKLEKRSYQPVEPGYHPAEHFANAQLRKQHPDDLLYFTVPKSYRPDRATGLIIFMHGGGPTSSRRAPRVFMNFPDEGTPEEDTFQLGNLFDATGMIAVGPSAPWDEESSNRWSVKESDQYLADVIAECKLRFNIDADRVFLIGHSMGGFGAYHHAQRAPDRYAAVIANSGSWKLGYWPTIRGTHLCIIQGVHDAAAGGRWHYTDIEYGRQTDKLLTQQHLDHTYLEHDGGHGMNNNKKDLAKFLGTADRFRRDPYCPHITLASPVGHSQRYLSPVRHNRWISLDEATDGKLPFDELRDNGADDFDAWRLSHVTTKRPGAAIDAVNRGENTIALTTQNAARCTVWLHPKMVDINKRVRVTIDDKLRFDERVRPTLLTALESYERRGDWGLVYPIKIELSVSE